MSENDVVVVNNSQETNLVSEFIPRLNSSLPHTTEEEMDIIHDLSSWTNHRLKSCFDQVLLFLQRCIGNSSVELQNATIQCSILFLKCCETPQHWERFYRELCVPIGYSFSCIIETLSRSLSIEQRTFATETELLLSKLSLCFQFFLDCLDVFTSSSANPSLRTIYSLVESILLLLQCWFSSLKQLERNQIGKENLVPIYKKSISLYVDLISCVNTISANSDFQEPMKSQQSSLQYEHEKAMVDILNLVVRMSMRIGMLSENNLGLKNLAWKTMKELCVRYKAQLLDKLNVEEIIDSLCEQIESSLDDCLHLMTTPDAVTNGNPPESNISLFRERLKLFRFFFPLLTSVWESYVLTISNDNVYDHVMDCLFRMCSKLPPSVCAMKFPSVVISQLNFFVLSKIRRYMRAIFIGSPNRLEKKKKIIDKLAFSISSESVHSDPLSLGQLLFYLEVLDVCSNEDEKVNNELIELVLGSLWKLMELIQLSFESLLIKNSVGCFEQKPKEQKTPKQASLLERQPILPSDQTCFLYFEALKGLSGFLLMVLHRISVHNSSTLSKAEEMPTRSRIDLGCIENFLFEHIVHPHPICYLLSRDLWILLIEKGNESFQRRQLILITEMLLRICSRKSSSMSLSLLTSCEETLAVRLAGLLGRATAIGSVSASIKEFLFERLLGNSNETSASMGYSGALTFALPYFHLTSFPDTSKRILLQTLLPSAMENCTRFLALTMNNTKSPEAFHETPSVTIRKLLFSVRILRGLFLQKDFIERHADALTKESIVDLSLQLLAKSSLYCYGSIMMAIVDLTSNLLVWFSLGKFVKLLHFLELLLADCPPCKLVIASLLSQSAFIKPDMNFKNQCFEKYQSLWCTLLLDKDYIVVQESLRFFKFFSRFSYYENLDLFVPAEYKPFLKNYIQCKPFEFDGLMSTSLSSKEDELLRMASVTFLRETLEWHSNRKRKYHAKNSLNNEVIPAYFKDEDLCEKLPVESYNDKSNEEDLKCTDSNDTVRRAIHLMRQGLDLLRPHLSPLNAAAFCSMSSSQLGILRNQITLIANTLNEFEESLQKL